MPSRSPEFSILDDNHINLSQLHRNLPGIYGMDFYCQLSRPGGRVAKRRNGRAKIGAKQRIDAETGKKWFMQKFDGVVSVKQSWAA